MRPLVTAGDTVQLAFTGTSTYTYYALYQQSLSNTNNLGLYQPQPTAVLLTNSSSTMITGGGTNTSPFIATLSLPAATGYYYMGVRACSSYSSCVDTFQTASGSPTSYTTFSIGACTSISATINGATYPWLTSSDSPFTSYSSIPGWPNVTGAPTNCYVSGQTSEPTMTITASGWTGSQGIFAFAIVNGDTSTLNPAHNSFSSGDGSTLTSPATSTDGPSYTSSPTFSIPSTQTGTFTVQYLVCLGFIYFLSSPTTSFSCGFTQVFQIPACPTAPAAPTLASPVTTSYQDVTASTSTYNYYGCYPSSVTDSFSVAFTPSSSSSVTKHVIQPIGYGIVGASVGGPVLPGNYYYYGYYNNCTSFTSASSTASCVSNAGYSTIPNPATGIATGSIGYATAGSTAINVVRFQIMACVSSTVFGDICTPSDFTSYIGKCYTTGLVAPSVSNVTSSLADPYGTVAPTVGTNAYSPSGSAFNCYAPGGVPKK